ncbi:hypothetical protein [Thalassobacillus sp. CUG 92003]|uniref:hypothetical protein n=1 Tax=Thalassobacillus sp. CUG 92003 TaxID=2736641 RepID=UPI0015E6E78C|nr:hypothetical protein [Thalassobacillus sp. CUG 92003]
MSILDLHKDEILEDFLKALLPKQSKYLVFDNLLVKTRKRGCPQGNKEYQFVIGIAPYKRGIMEKSSYEDNRGSIPDAWVCGRNFNLLFEFKIRGTLDEAQIAAHKKIFNNECNIIRLQWSQVVRALDKLKTDNQLITFLIEEYLKVTVNFKSKRNASGMPKEIISARKKEKEMHFIITGSRKVKPYTVHRVIESNKVIVNDNLGGIQEARRWIAEYVLQNKNSLPLTYEGMKTVVTDYCVVPGSAEKNNAWNQWRLGAYIREDNN